MKIMFMGTPDFAAASLDALVSGGYDVASVVTQPDKKKGRGHKMSHTPVYEYAKAHEIEIFQPENLKKENFEEILNLQNPDIIVVAAYGKILDRRDCIWPDSAGADSEPAEIRLYQRARVTFAEIPRCRAHSKVHYRR